MQTIYYNFTRKYLCDASGTAVSGLPEITFAEKPTWRIVPVDDSGTVVIPSGISVFRAAVKFDFHSDTVTAIRTLNEQIACSTSGIDVQLNANTDSFLAAVDGQETRAAFFELSGLDSSNGRVFYLSFRIQAHMILDPDLDNNLPEEVASNYLDLPTAATLLAQKTDNSDFNALSGRVSAVETALPGKAASADAVQPGTVQAFAGDAAQIPNGYLLCNGAAVSRTDYAALFAAIGTIYGSGDESTTFNLPDFRGKFLRGYLSGTSAALGTAQSDAIRNISGSIGYIPTTYTPTESAPDLPVSATSPFRFISTGTLGINYDSAATQRTVGNLVLDVARNVPVATENRPANYAVNYIIKY